MAWTIACLARKVGDDTTEKVRCLLSKILRINDRSLVATKDADEFFYLSVDLPPKEEISFCRNKGLLSSLNYTTPSPPPCFQILDVGYGAGTAVGGTLGAARNSVTSIDEQSMRKGSGFPMFTRVVSVNTLVEADINVHPTYMTDKRLGAAGGGLWPG